MSRLHIYTVHINPELPAPYEEAQFVEEGFNWKAFIFVVFWALYYRLWLPALGIVTVNGLILLLTLNGLSTGASLCMHLAWHTIIGFSANDWLRKKLKKQGFITADIVTGDSLIRAEQRFFDRYFKALHNTPAFANL